MGLEGGKCAKSFLLRHESHTLLRLISFLWFGEFLDHAGPSVFEVSKVPIVYMRRYDFLDVFEVRIFENLLSCDSLGRVENEHFLYDFGEAL